MRGFGRFGREPSRGARSSCRHGFAGAHAETNLLPHTRSSCQGRVIWGRWWGCARVLLSFNFFGVTAFLHEERKKTAARVDDDVLFTTLALSYILPRSIPIIIISIIIRARTGGRRCGRGTRAAARARPLERQTTASRAVPPTPRRPRGRGTFYIGLLGGVSVWLQHL